MVFLGFTELPCNHLPGLEPLCRKQLATDKESVFSYAKRVPHCQEAFSQPLGKQAVSEGTFNGARNGEGKNRLFQAGDSSSGSFR